MINKPQLSGGIARWVLLLQEFNFTVEVRPDKSHVNADHLSRLEEESELESIDDSFPDAQLFCIDVIPREYAKIIEYLQNNKFPINFNNKQKRRLAFKAMSYTIIADTLYKKRKDEVLRRCVTSSEISLILKKCHDNMARGHSTGDVTAIIFLQSGYWWPTFFY